MSVDKIVEYIENFDSNKINKKYRDYLDTIKVMTGAGIVEVLNQSCFLMDKDKIYLEVGCHMGSMLLGAALDNNEHLFVGVDNFVGHVDATGRYNNPEEGLKDVIEKRTSGNVIYYNSTYQDFFVNQKEKYEKKVEIYVYDADHGKENQYEGLKQSLSMLADEAIIFVDDSCQQDRVAVWYGINRMLKEHSDNISFVREFKNSCPNDIDGMWNGLAVLRYKK